MWYVYFLKLSNNDIYVGSTNDLRRRVTSHNDERGLERLLKKPRTPPTPKLICRQ